MSILKATNRESVSSVIGVHVGIAATEIEVGGVKSPVKRTAPNAAGGPATDERTKGAVAVARHRQLKCCLPWIIFTKARFIYTSAVI